MKLKAIVFVLGFVILWLLQRNKAVVATELDTIAKECEPKGCGTGPNISYPFWLQDQQPSYCGYPSLNLTCQNSRPLIRVLAHGFYINSIDYDSRSVIFTAVEFVNRTTCPLYPINYTASFYPYTMSDSNRLLFFLLNCSAPLHGYGNYPCTKYGKLNYFGGVYNSTAKQNSDSSECMLVTVPVANYSGSNDSGDGFSKALSGGWLMNWDLPSCSECRSSGGTCGYDNITSNFACFCSDREHKGSCKSDKRRTIIIGSVAASGALLLLAVLFLLYERRKRWYSSPIFFFRKNALPDKFSTKDGEMSAYFKTPLFSYNELQEATNNFDSSKELGDGGFGTVYKGKLRDGRTVAIKRLYENNYKRLDQFMNEVEILSRLRHQNLVSLYGCTSRHSRELLLVYEFATNGTVADHIHGSRAAESILSWPLRLNIAIETADALAYLHAVDPPIIHRDVKTNNILLDSTFRVKVADFGLSRLFPTDVTHVSTAPQGTPGYVDPEYHKCYQLTDRSDVYSFGVVLIELISSKPAVDITRQKSEINLANMAISKIQNGEVDQLVDMGLGYQSDDIVRKMITMVAELAFRCLQQDGDMRPSIKEVLDVLREIQCLGYKKVEDDDRIRDDIQLLKNIAPFSPDSVMHKWMSRSTTPNTSG